MQFRTAHPRRVLLYHSSILHDLLFPSVTPQPVLFRDTRDIVCANSRVYEDPLSSNIRKNVCCFVIPLQRFTNILSTIEIKKFRCTLPHLFPIPLFNIGIGFKSCLLQNNNFDMYYRWESEYKNRLIEISCRIIWEEENGHLFPRGLSRTVIWICSA